MSSKDPFVEIGAGKPVFSLGETGTEMFLVESGQVELSGGGVRTPLGPGDFFGEDFLLDGKPRSQTAMVVESARLLRLSRNTLAEVIAENPEIALGIMRRLLERSLEDSAARRPGPAAPAPAVPIESATRKPPPAEVAQRAPAPNPAPASAPAASAALPEPAAPEPAEPPPPARNPALRHVATGQLLPLDMGRTEFLVGRPDAANGINPEVDLGPYDQNRSLSRRHAKIVMRDGVYFVREDSSTPNGTYVSDERIATGVDVPLKLGDRIRFGTIEVEFVAV